ncbi:SDR family NAD(P)-dependent oxidoreductase [Streptomyces huiliensis]|uniref:SDR family NAD(P)-dependent oxidoreductase n=1 Tax=Streptomyces huiliensis TaxID=2876027 RepID=UPI001CBCCAED|nr:SDR family oxidoreductase [Streptomyces huiliensis]MBZ4322007.1 SDR family oxidoreductase [Streptomyces huiliensis]
MTSSETTTSATGTGPARRAVIVTGGSRGLGRAVTRRLAGEGYDVALCGRSEGPLETAAAELRERWGATVHAESLDAQDGTALDEFVRRAAAALGRVDALVACAGGARGAGLLDSTDREWEETYRLNVAHPVAALRSAVPHLRRTRGCAVLVSSVSGWKPAPPAQYAAAKAAQIHLAATLARELGPDGIRVNCVSPGSMLIPGKGWARLREEDPEAYRAFEREFPAGELIAPEDVASVIAFLLSGQARAVNGANIPVDGGQNAPSAYGY